MPGPYGSPGWVEAVLLVECFALAVLVPKYARLHAYLHACWFVFRTIKQINYYFTKDPLIKHHASLFLTMLLVRMNESCVEPGHLARNPSVVSTCVALRGLVCCDQPKSAS